MPILDSCINGTFFPGNIGSSTGTTPVIVYVGTLYTPDNYPFDTIQYSLDFSRFYNSFYLGAL